MLPNVTRKWRISLLMSTASHVSEALDLLFKDYLYRARSFAFAKYGRLGVPLVL